jgi:hypothetical protein
VANAGIVQLRHDTEGRVYYRRTLADGKTSREAMRCLKRRLSHVVYGTDTIRYAAAGVFATSSTTAPREFEH